MNNKTVNSCRAQFYIRAGAALSPQMFWLKQQYAVLKPANSFTVHLVLLACVLGATTKKRSSSFCEERSENRGYGYEFVHLWKKSCGCPCIPPKFFFL